MTGDGVKVSLALKKVHVGIAAEGAIYACGNRSHQPRAFSHRGSHLFVEEDLATDEKLRHLAHCVHAAASCLLMFGDVVR